MNDRDIDAEFDAIVARWDEATDAPPESPSPAAPTPPVAPPVAPPKPRTVQDITSAYAALSRREPDPPSPEAEPTPTAGSPGDGEAGTGRDASHEVTSGEREEPEAWRAGPSIDDEDDHFEPPAVQLPPGEDIGYWGAVLGLVGGPLLLLWVVVSEPFYGGWWTLGAILLLFGGFGLLVMRQPKDRDPFDDDNGARV
ncbi:hypothetical protein ACOCJ5_16030 [Knoellia sp. CPCC 206450]|uniref:hypothetical protein n=1 Tax=Knoellia tibetensis TaxID=3404798 RepID=UPI003B42BD5B